MPRVEHPPEVQAQALALLATGVSVNAVARQLGVAPSTVVRWRDRPQAVAMRHEMQQAVTLDVGALVAQYLAANLGALTALAQSFGDPLWIGEQGAADRVAVHHELSERAIRILSAIQPGGGVSPDPGPAPAELPAD